MTTTSSRLLSLLSLLQMRRDWPGATLAERLNVSSRTVRRDIDRLRELGYRIEAFMGPDGGYRLDAGADLPPLLFDDEQAVALTIGLQLAATSGAGIEEGALRALTTLRQVMPSRLRHRVDAVPVVTVRAPDSAAEAGPGVLTTISAVVHAREVLRFDYVPAAPDVSATPARPRRVEPHHLATWRGSWYLIAWDLERDDWRTFRVDRVRPRTPNGPRFSPRELPGGDVETFLVGRFRGAEGSTAWPCRGEAVVDLPATDVRPFIGDGLAEAVDERRTRVTMGSWSWTGLAASLLRFDAAITAVRPTELADAFAEIAARSLAASRPHLRGGSAT